MHSDSAEEKLLKLIKDTTGQKSKQRRQEDEFKKVNLAKASVAPAANRPFILFGLIAKLKSLDLETVNKILRLGLGLVILLFVLDFFFSAKTINNLFKQEAAVEGKNELDSLPKPLKSESSDNPSADKRDIFSASGAQGLGEARLKSSSGPANFISNLKLLGVIAGGKPQAIIEDSIEQKTYTVGVGDYFKEFVVEEIGSGKVTFSYKGEKFDLFL